LEPFNGPSKVERIAFRNGIWDFQSFYQSETGNWRSIALLFCLETEYSSDVGRQNSVFSKPFSGQSHMSNGEKAGRVAQVFGVQLRNKFFLEQFHFRFLLTSVCFIQISIFAFLYGVSDIFMSAF
jgi:hypothetical protein